MSKRLYFKLTYKDSSKKNKKDFNYNLFAEFPFVEGLTPDMVLELVGLTDCYTAEELTRDEYLSHTEEINPQN